MYYYDEYNPDIQLTHWVETYWAASGFINSEDVTKILPDGCVDIIFMFDETKGSFYTGLVGTMTTFFEIDYRSVQMFGIRFKPAGITAFTRVPVEEFTDRNVELALVETLFSKSFCEAFSEKQSIAERITYTDSYLVSLLPYLYRSDRQIIRAVDLIYLAKGQIPLAAVASDICLCQRHFERKFKSAIGINPKLFAKIFRFKHALR
ncbi:MAG: AraC family transcriptional regulator, partial [Bacteroidales bacterium]|nr:AraC family transcriptional regulator [Bacteroidales bacterium]